MTVTLKKIFRHVSAVSLIALLPVATAYADADREKVLEWFTMNQFGERPPAAEKPNVSFGEKSITITEGDRSVTINLFVKIPQGADERHKAPVFVYGDMATLHGKWHGVWPNVPTNSIIDRGYAYICYNFNDVAPNAQAGAKANTWARGIFELYGGAERTDSSWGTISAWAWGFSRVMDWIERQPQLDAKHVAVVGLSRGGKTALWAGATDPRIAMACSSCSGCGGAQQLRLKVQGSEKIAAVTAWNNYHYWFCCNWKKWAGKEETLPYDASDLLGLMKGRLAYVSSGSNDKWAGPDAETAATEIARTNGVTVGRHIHAGRHDCTTEDWLKYVDFADEQWGPSPCR